MYNNSTFELAYCHQLHTRTFIISFVASKFEAVFRCIAKHISFWSFCFFKLKHFISCVLVISNSHLECHAVQQQHKYNVMIRWSKSCGDIHLVIVIVFNIMTNGISISNWITFHISFRFVLQWHYAVLAVAWCWFRFDFAPAVLDKLSNIPFPFPNQSKIFVACMTKLIVWYALGYQFTA